MRISKLSPAKGDKGRFLVACEGGALLRVGEREVVSLALYAGKELTAEETAELERAARESGLRDHALDLLAARPMSRKGLTDRLREKRAATEAEAEAVADELERLGLLNDGEYAKALVRHYADKGYGPYKLREELYRRGVPRALWEEALREAEDPAEAIDALVRQRLRGKAPDRKEFKRVSDALARRGYRWSDIRAALTRYGADLQEEE